MARPDTQALTQFPVTWPLYREHQRRWEIDQILRLHDGGYFAASAGLVDEMMTDDRIAGVTDQRASALLSKPFEFRPSGDSEDHLGMKELLGGDGQDIQGLWRQMANTAALREVMGWGWYIGIGLAEIVWLKNPRAEYGQKWLPRLVPYHPSWIRWDWTYNTFVLNTPENGQILLPRPDEQPNGDGKWFVYCPWGVRGGWRRALVRSLADKYIQRKWNERDWARYCEKNGLAIVVAKVPMGASNAEDRQRYFDSVKNLGSETTVFAPQGSNGEASYDIDLKEPTAQTWQAFQAWKKALDEDIAIRIVGQLDTTSSAKGGVGNTGNQNQGDVALNILGEDAEIGSALRQQLFAWHVEYNTGHRELTPYCEFQVSPPDDEKTTADAQASKGAAVNAWKLAGAAVDVDAEAEKAGMILLPPEKRHLALAPPAQRRALPPMSGGDEGAAVGEGEPADGAEGEAPLPGERPKARTKLRSYPQAVRARYPFQGLPIAVENPKGSVRTWLGPDGQPGQTTMRYDYGYIEGWLGEDGEDIDCYIGPDESAPDVHIVHQLAAPDFKKHDEMKVFLGFADAATAKEEFLAHRDDAGAFGAMTTMPLDRFKAKLKRRAPTSTTRIRARADLAGAAALRAPKVAAGRDRASIYVDQLVASAKRQGAKDVRPFLEGLLRAVRDGEDWEDVKRRSLHLLRTSKGSTSVAQTMLHTRIMARMMGRAAILEQHAGE